jgi:hypothetical protein
MAAIDEDILKDVREILGQEININKQGWAIYWCPKHPDEQRAGTQENLTSVSISVQVDTTAFGAGSKVDPCVGSQKSLARITNPNPRQMAISSVESQREKVLVIVSQMSTKL